MQVADAPGFVDVFNSVELLLVPFGVTGHLLVMLRAGRAR
jgi:hypothetical protein